MKKTILILCMLALPTIAKAQTDAQPSMETKIPQSSYATSSRSNTNLGLQLGSNISDARLSTKMMGDKKARARFLMGGYGEFDINQSLALRPELNFVQKGFKLDLGSYLTSLEGNLNMSYLEIPLLVKARFLDSERAHPFVLVGPQISFLTASSVDVAYEDTNIASVDTDRSFRGVVFGYSAGAGLDYDINSQITGNVQVRYSSDITNAVKSESGEEQKNWGVQLLAGVSFNM